MMAEVICPALAAGKLVLCDRFVSSTLAYQLGGDGLTADEIRAAAEMAIRGRWPDLTILLDMPTDRSLARAVPKFAASKGGKSGPLSKDRIEQRPIEYHEQVRQNYLAQAEADPARYRVIDADRDKAAVADDVWRAVRGAQNAK